VHHNSCFRRSLSSESHFTANRLFQPWHVTCIGTINFPKSNFDQSTGYFKSVVFFSVWNINLKYGTTAFFNSPYRDQPHRMSRLFLFQFMLIKNLDLQPTVLIMFAVFFFRISTEIPQFILATIDSPTSFYNPPIIIALSFLILP
jgi:hypothetical protein